MAEITPSTSQNSNTEPEFVEIKIKYWNQDDNLRKIIKKKVPGKNINGHALLRLLEADNVPVEHHIIRYFNNADQGFEMLDAEMEFPVSEGQVFEFLLERIANSSVQSGPTEQAASPIKNAQDDQVGQANGPIYLYPRNSPRPPAQVEQEKFLQKYGSNPNVSGNSFLRSTERSKSRSNFSNSIK